MRSRLDEQLHLLNEELTKMGLYCEEVIELAARALEERDEELIKKVEKIDAKIDRKERDIEDLCFKLLLQQQPVARDLRAISAALKMITDMERIGDQAEDIAEIVNKLEGNKTENIDIIQKMAKGTINMVINSIRAYVKSDVEIAKQVYESDEEIDQLFKKVKKALIQEIAANPEDGEYAINLLMIAKYLERVGDHATNIAEWVTYSVTGEH